jgi:hypothetical protein
LVAVKPDTTFTFEQRREKMNYFDTDDPETKDLTPAIKLLDGILAGKNNPRRIDRNDA